MASAREQAAGTGDLKNNIIKLLREIHRMKLKVEPNHKGLCMGIPSSFLPILHAALMDYSLPLAKHIVNKGIKMYARTDLKFTEALYKVMRDVFNYRPKVNKEQFLSEGFAERKVILTFDLLCLCQVMHEKLQRNLPENEQVQSNKGLGNGRSQINVYTLADMAGIGRVWEEKPTRHRNGHKDRDIVAHPSPPVVMARREYNRNQYEAIPLAVPSSSSQVESPSDGSSDDINQPPHSQEPHPLQANPRPVEKHVTIREDDEIEEPRSFEEIKPHTPLIETIVTKDTLLVEDDLSSSSDGDNQTDDCYTSKENNDYICQQLSLMSERMGQMELMIEKLNSKIVLLETQMKINENNHASLSVKSYAETGTQTHSVTFSPTVHHQTPTNKINTPPNRINTPPNRINTLPKASSRISPILKTSFTSTPLHMIHHAATPSQIQTSNSLNESIQTKEIIDKLRNRAQKTKELLHGNKL